MTEQEAKTLAVRLTRIWEPEWVQDTLDSEWRTYEDECWYYAQVQDNVYIQADELGSEIFFSLNFHSENDYLGCFTAYPDGRVEVSEEIELLAEKYLPLFRRGCWLSGCPIEATAHEKAEWMQGFTSEELQSWNLKI